MVDSAGRRERERRRESAGAGASARDFPFARNFLLISLLVITIATGLSTWYTINEVRQELTDNAVEYAAEIVTNLFHQVEEEYLRPLLERGETYDHRDPEQVEALGEVIARSTFNHHVRKLYFFNPTGLIVFSSERDHIDFQVAGNENLEEALRGKLSWTIRRRNDPLDLTGDPSNEELLETYVPITSALAPAPGEIAGVIEIYQSVEDLRADLDRSWLRIVRISVFSMGALLCVFTFFIVRADRAIRERRRDLVRSNRALTELSRDLEGLVEKRTQQLIDKQKLASLGGIAAGIAHEINTPLATIAACAEGLVKRIEPPAGSIDPELAEHARHYLGLIESEAFRCKEILRNLLDYSRQSPVVEAQEIDLDALVDQSMVLVRLRKDSREVTFDESLEAESGGVRGDPAQIRQVIHNLIDNALHAVRGAPERRIALRTRSREDGAVVFECEDSGGGIAADIRTKIFEPFFTTKASRDGIGLGLALCYSIAERHGGTLELVHGGRGDGAPPEGALGGACFRLTLWRDGADPTERGMP